MKKIIPILIGLLFPGLILAQNDLEALRYSTYDLTGSARFVASGGAFQAVGGNFTSLSYNPGGLAVFVGSEIVGTPNLSFNTYKSSFFENTTKETQFNFNFNNLGVVFHNPVVKKNKESLGKGWISTSLAFGMNRIANFNQQMELDGFNPYSSYLDYYLEQLNAGEGIAPGDVYNSYPFGAGLAYDAYLIDPNPADSMKYISKIRNGGVQQKNSIKTKGAIDEWLGSFAANYNNKLYIGATLGVPFLRYAEESIYTENDINDSIPDFEQFVLTENLTTKGTGVNFKLGFIYRITYGLRIGMSVHTPTAYFMRDVYSSSIYSSLGNNEEYNVESPDGDFSYSFSTPWRFMGGIAFVFKNIGFLSADIEHVSYGQARYSFENQADKDFENDLNNSISSKYQPVTTFKFGGEYKLGFIRLRAGYNFYGGVFKPGVNPWGQDNSGNAFTLGAGFRFDMIYLDIAYKNQKRLQNYGPYTLAPDAQLYGVADVTQRKESVALTLGLRF
jgi:hypothetical protein